MAADALSRYQALAAKVDDFFARVAARHAADLRCRPGCATCCVPGLTVTGVEAAAIVAHIGALDATARAALAPPGPAGGCVALDAAGSCRIYGARPLVCRSHGVPIRLPREGGLPVIQACELNFTARGPAVADPDCVLDQTTLSATLLAIDRLHAAEQGADPGARQDLANVIREACAA